MYISIFEDNLLESATLKYLSENLAEKTFKSQTCH